MSLEQISMDALNWCANNPLYVLVGSALAATGAVATGIHLYRKNHGNQNRVLSASELALKREQEEDEEEYKPRSVRGAFFRRTENNSSEIEGIISEYHILADDCGFSGIIQDNSGKAPFILLQENIDTMQGAGLVPIILKHSMESKQKIKVSVACVIDELELGDSEKTELVNPILNVQQIEYEMDGEKYIL